jgi:hypothetical protein
MTGKHTGAHLRPGQQRRRPPAARRASPSPRCCNPRATRPAASASGAWATKIPPGVPTRQGFDAFYGVLHQIHAHFHYPGYFFDGENIEEAPRRPRLYLHHLHQRYRGYLRRRFHPAIRPAEDPLLLLSPAHPAPPRADRPREDGAVRRQNPRRRALPRSPQSLRQPSQTPHGLRRHDLPARRLRRPAHGTARKGEGGRQIRLSSFAATTVRRHPSGTTAAFSTPPARCADTKPRSTKAASGRR